MQTLLWIVGGVAIVAAAMAAVHAVELSERLTSAFLSLTPQLPTWLSFDQFLLALLLVAVAALGIVLLAGVGLLGWMQRRVALAQRREAAQESVVKQAVERLRAQVQHEYERLIGLSALLTQRLDKQPLFQNILHAAEQITSVPQTASVVGLWVVDFETDRMRFAVGSRCDERWFTQTEFEATERPFVRLIGGRSVLQFAKWQDGFPIVKPEYAAQLAQTPSLLLVPLIVEQTVLGCLVVYCHRDVVATYEQQHPFFSAAWGQLSLALSIAIQGELAILDRLTGVANHAYFVKRLSQEIERANRYRVPVGLLMVDIDNFKAVNDALGHLQGDAVLKVVARLLKKCSRAIDLVGRYGGEEFIVLLPETGWDQGREGSGGVQAAAGRIREAVEEEFRGFQKPLAVTVSIGAAVRRFPEDRAVNARELIRLTDEQLYNAKTTGKNRTCLALPATSRNQEIGESGNQET